MIDIKFPRNKFVMR